MRKKQFTGACLVTTICLGLGLAGCQNKVATEQKSSMAVSESADAQSLAVSPEDAGLSVNMDSNGGSFKPADYTLPVKDEYVYEYLGLKFKLSEKIREAMKAKDIVMLDDQSPIDQTSSMDC